MPKEQTATEIPPTRVPSDDCGLEINGDVYFPHRGQWVDVVLGPRSIRELKLIWGFNSFQVELDGIQSDQEEARRAMLAIIEKLPPATEDEETDAQKRERTKIQVQIDAQIEVLAEAGQRRYDMLSGRYDQFAEDVAEHLVDWNWTNRLGRPLQKPDGTIGPIQDLTPDEIYYLRQVVSGESPLQKKSV